MSDSFVCAVAQRAADMENIRAESRRRKVAEVMNIDGDVEALMEALKEIEEEGRGVDVLGQVVTIGDHSFIPWMSARIMGLWGGLPSLTTFET